MVPICFFSLKFSINLELCTVNILLVQKVRNHLYKGEFGEKGGQGVG